MTSGDFKKNKFDFALLVILAVATLLRFYHLGFQSAWLDEVNTFIYADPKFSLNEIHQKILQVEGTPDFFFIIVKFICLIFGHTVFTLRILSAMAGVLSVYYIFLLTEKLFDRKTAYLSAILLTFSYFAIEYSQEARSYSLLIFLIIFSYNRLVIFINNKTYKNAAILGFCVGLIPNAHIFGLLNVATIYLTILSIFVVTKGKHEKIEMFKKLLLAGIISIIVFLPVIQILQGLSKTQTHWIPAASIDGIKYVFTDLLGKSLWLAIAFILSALLYFVCAIFVMNKKPTAPETKNKLMFGILILSIWFVMNIATIIVRSYTSEASLILTRYFAGVLPAFIIAAAFVLSLIPNKIIRISVVAVFVLFSMYNIIVVNDYYNRVSKAQYDKLTADIIKRNVDNDPVVSCYGWFLNYYFDNSTSTNIIPATFQDYINSMKTDALSKKSFWYFDGNSRPYNLNAEEQKFLDENFVMDVDLNMYFDSWAKHYTSKTIKDAVHKPKDLNNNQLVLEDFEPRTQNSKGDLLMFESNPITSKEIQLSQGQYTLDINGYSLPEKPINGENAHIQVSINNNVAGQFYLSENPKGIVKTVKFSLEKAQDVKVKIVFDNDILVGQNDRNAVITSILLKKE